MSERGRITAKQVFELVKQQRFRCAISGRTLAPETASLDHIVPLAHEGAHALENVWIVDHQVNTAKGTLTLEQFVAICRDVVEYQESKHQGSGDEPSETVPPAGPPNETLF